MSDSFYYPNKKYKRILVAAPVFFLRLMKKTEETNYLFLSDFEICVSGHNSFANILNASTVAAFQGIDKT